MKKPTIMIESLENGYICTAYDEANRELKCAVATIDGSSYDRHSLSTVIQNLLELDATTVKTDEDGIPGLGDFGSSK